MRPPVVVALAGLGTAALLSGGAGTRVDVPHRPAVLATVSQPAPAGQAAVLASAAQPVPPGQAAVLDTATFAAGCFWSVELAFDRVDGVVSTTSGFAGGSLENPTYAQVSRGGTGHVESVQVVYDPARVSYPVLLAAYWHNVDPFTRDRQFCDAGPQYAPAIFYHDPLQQRLAEASKQTVATRFAQPIVVEILPAGRFHPAEASHQDFAARNPDYYERYRRGCGRDRRLREIWGAEAGH